MKSTVEKKKTEKKKEKKNTVPYNSPQFDYISCYNHKTADENVPPWIPRKNVSHLRQLISCPWDNPCVNKTVESWENLWMYCLLDHASGSGDRKR